MLSAVSALLVTLVLPQGKPITLDVTPRFASATPKRAWVRALIRIEPHEQNTFYSFAYDGPETYSTLRSMNEFSDRFYDKRFELPPGNYLFHACVIRNERPKPKSYCASGEVEIK